MSSFKRFYLWGMTAKLYMGIYFAAIVFVTGLITAIYGGTSLRLVVLLEMFAVSIAAGFTQTWLLPPSLDFSRGILFGRSALWLLLSTALCTAVAILGGWFQGLPAWCPWLLGAILLIGFACMLLGMKMEQEADTLRLNESLWQYQARNDC